MKTSRSKLYAAAAVIVLAVAAFFLFRKPLTPEEQLRANMSALESAVESGSPRGVLNYIADDFNFNGTNRDEFERLVRGAFIQATNTEVERSNETIRIRGEEATVTGDFAVTYKIIRESREAPAHRMSGNYSLQWRNIDGNWMIVGADGATRSEASGPGSGAPSSPGGLAPNGPGSETLPF